MLLRKLRLKNFKIHRDLTLHFTAGINGIVGNNGAGKSSIVDAISFVLLGLFPDGKTNAITLGETTGFVSCDFILDGKEGYIERHLDSSKVVLKYDGVDYKKSSEVKAVWDKLVNITPDIFQNVIVSRQKEIALLFTGDQSVREKMFQKIFFVPNTNKARDVIWKYIKDSPGLHVLENTDDIERDYHEADSRLSELSKEAEETPDYTPLIRETEATIADLKEDIRIAAEVEECLKRNWILQPLMKPLEEEAYDLQGKIEDIEEDLPDLVEASSAANKAYGTFMRVKKIKSQLAEIHPKTVDRLAETEAALKAKMGCHERLSNEFGVATDQLAKKEEELELCRAAVNSGSAVCLACGSKIKNIKDHLNKINREAEDLRLLVLEKQELFTESKGELANLETSVTSLRRLVAGRSMLLDELSMLEDAGAPLEDPVLLERELRELQAQERTLRNKQRACLDQFSVYNEEFTRNQKFIEKHQHPLGEAVALETALEHAENRLADEREKRDKALLLKGEILTAEMSLRHVKERVAKYNAGFRHNTEVMEYKRKLETLYDFFHTSNFPRKLVQGYTTSVAELINENLKHFNFNYSVDIDPTFKILVKDEQDRTLPSVSGGQEVMIGICLKLALHNLFGQLFPMLILDEPSQNLDKDNQKNLFQCIDVLKSQVKLKQVFIVDHNEGLTAVVDNLVRL